MISDEDLEKGGIVDTEPDELRISKHEKMVRYYEKDIGQNYTNVIEKTLQFLYDEFMISMVYIGLFDINSMKFIKRRVFWYLVILGFGSLIFVYGIGIISILSYIATTIGKL